MHLVQILLPLVDDAGAPFPPEHYRVVGDLLTERFGGLTAYTRAPAEGRWKQGGDVARDEIVIFEVMAKTLERGWWRDYRSVLERRFAQESIVIRAHTIETL